MRNIRTHSRAPIVWLHLPLFLASLVFAAGCSVHESQSPPASPPSRPTLRELVPNAVTVGSAGTLILRGANFLPGSRVASPAPGLSFTNIRVNSSQQITADYANSPDSPLGYFKVTVTTAAGTSEPAIFTITPLAFRFGAGLSLPGPAQSAPPSYRALQVGIHADQVANPDGSQTDAYLNVSFQDGRGHPVKVSDSRYSDMDNVDVPDDDADQATAAHSHVTSYSFGVENPAAGQYVLQIAGARTGSFTLEISDESLTQEAGSAQHGLTALEKIPIFPGSPFALRFVCRNNPCEMAIDSGGLQPPNAAFSFAQPSASKVRLPVEVPALPVVIYYDPLIDGASFQALLDGADRSSMFHVRPGELQLVALPVTPGQHTLIIRAKTNRDLLTEQTFDIQH